MSNETNDTYDDLDDASFAIGYNNDFDVESLPSSDIDLHDDILDYSLADLDALDLPSLTDLQRWAAAQQYADVDADEVSDEEFDHREAQYEKIVRMILEGQRSHPAISYEDLCVELMNDYIVAERHEEARAFLPTVAAVITSDPHVIPRFTAIIDCASGDVEAGLEAFDAMLENAPNDAELHVAIGADLIACSMFEQAENTLERARDLAQADGDEELLLEIDDYFDALTALRDEA